MVTIGSQICSYMSGQVIYLDYGLTSARDIGCLTNSRNLTIRKQKIRHLAGVEGEGRLESLQQSPQMFRYDQEAARISVF